MKFCKSILSGVFVVAMAAGAAGATERLFTYTYEPETMPQGDREFEQWVTLRTPRNAEAGFDNFYRWDFREELEYGVNDNWQLALYLNTKYEHFRGPGDDTKTSDFDFDGVSIENKFMIWNPVNHGVGLSLYIEPTFSDKETELEEKIILGQRDGDWKWALNITHETEWGEDETEGVLEFTFGAARELNKHWSLGFEFRNHNEIGGYEEWEHTAFFIGPVVHYRSGNWWAALTALGQVYGKDYEGDKDGESNFSLKSHEYLNIRCIIGFDF